MKSTICVALFSIIALLSVSCADGEEQELRQRIERIEGSMLPAVSVVGEDRFTSSIWELMERFNVPGVSVAVINNGELEWAKGYGVLEVGGAPVNTETLFLAGHMSQAVATLGALRIVNNGQLDIDGNVNDWLETWHVPDNDFTASEHVTVRHLLTHTSGLSIRSLLGYLPGDSIPSTPQILDGEEPATNEPVRVLAEPGAAQNYSLGGYVVLQQLLEDVTEMSYSNFLDSAVLTPLRMNRSFHEQPLSEMLSTNAATGHEPTNEPVNGRWRVYPELAALGLWTTPTDLARLVLELQSALAGEPNRLLSQSSAEEILSRQFENRGLGVEVGGEGDWRFFRLEGHGNNYLSEMFAYSSQGTGAVVMTNSSNGEGVKAHILRAIAAEHGWPDLLQEEISTVALPIGTLQELTGTYRFRGRDRNVRLEEGRLVQSPEGGTDQDLLPLSEDLLISRTFGYRYGIERDTSGAVTGLTLILGDTRLFTYERVTEN